MNTKKQLGILYCLGAILSIVLIWLDQFTKHLAVLGLRGGRPFVLLPGVFELRYLENRGAAFGLLQGQKFFFIFIALLVLCVILYVIIKAPYQKQYIKLHMALVLIASGAAGNVIDRIRYDYVVDFLYFSLINFPIFNVADIYVTLASIYLVILLLFVYKEADLEFLTFRARRFRDSK